MDSLPCTAPVPPAAYTSLRDRSLTLCVQVTPFTQCCFNIEQLVRDLGHIQQFRRCLIEPATIHTQWCSQNLVKPVPPPYYCDDIVVFFIVLYCITIAAVSHLTHPVAGMTSHMTHRAVWLSSQAASLYSAVALYHWCAHKFYLHMTMSCSSWWNHHIAHVWHSVLYLTAVLTIQKASNNLPSQLQVLKTFLTISISFALSDSLTPCFAFLSSRLALHFTQPSSHCASFLPL